MLNIRIKNIASCNRQNSKYFMNIQENSIVKFEGDLARVIFDVLLGKTPYHGDIILNETSMVADLPAYMKLIQYISLNNRKRIDNIAVREYIEIFSVLTVEREDHETAFSFIESMMHFMNLDYLLEQNMSQVSEDEKLLIEIIATSQKRPKLILLEDFWLYSSANSRDKIIEFLQCYIDSHNAIGIILSSGSGLSNDFFDYSYKIGLGEIKKVSYKVKKKKFKELHNV